MRRAARRDETEQPIVKGLEQLGYQVQRQVLPDLLIRDPRTGHYHLLEVQGIARGRKRAPVQLAWLTAWRVPIVRTLDDAIRALDAPVTY